MAQQPIPPTPPLTSEGFASATWQRWLEILRKRLGEAYSPINPEPTSLLAITAPGQVANIGELRKVAVIRKKDAILKNLELLGTLLVDLTTHLVGNAQMDGTLTVNGDTQIVSTLTVDGTTHLKDTLKVDGTSQLVGNVEADGSLVVGTAFGCNGKAVQTAYTLPGAATDLPTAITLVNAIAAALKADGICQ